MKLLRQYRHALSAQNEASRLMLLTALREVCPAHLKGCHLWVYGSLAHEGRFGPESDIDLALDHEPEDMSIYGVSGWLSEALGRRVDVALLPETRLKHTIVEEGISWIV
jgi:predicted nucleotidyltransferase